MYDCCNQIQHMFWIFMQIKLQIERWKMYFNAVNSCISLCMMYAVRYTKSTMEIVCSMYSHLLLPFFIFFFLVCIRQINRLLYPLQFNYRTIHKIRYVLMMFFQSHHTIYDHWQCTFFWTTKLEFCIYIRAGAKIFSVNRFLTEFVFRMEVKISIIIFE